MRSRQTALSVKASPHRIQAIAAAVTAVILPQTAASPGLNPGVPPTVPVRSVDAVPRPSSSAERHRAKKATWAAADTGLSGDSCDASTSWVCTPGFHVVREAKPTTDAEMTICSVDTRGGQQPLEVQSPARHEAERLGVAAHALPAACPLVWTDCGRQRCFRTRGEEAHEMTGHTSRLSSWSSRF